MTQEQTSLVGNDIKVLVNVVDPTGDHVAAVIDTTTTRIHGNSAVPTVTTISTGVYEITFSGVSPAPAEGDKLIVKVNGTISGTPWTEYGIPVKILDNEITTTDILTAGDIDGYSIEETMKICLSALGGIVSGAGTTTITFRAADDSKDRITATVDVNGNRSSVTLDATG